MNIEKLYNASFTFLFTGLISPIIAVVFGAISGWSVGLFFESTIRETLGAFGVNPPVAMWQIGATLGFVGKFFNSSRINGEK